jgi:hypothetical protein
MWQIETRHKEKQVIPLEPEPNSCVLCKFEKTCGYSHLATINERTIHSYKKCSLGLHSYTHKPFFEPKEE